jgi:hypothetical protein
VNVIVAAQGGEALDLCSGVNGRAVADAHIVFDDDEGSDGDAGAQGRSGMNDCRRGGLSSASVFPRYNGGGQDAFGDNLAVDHGLSVGFPHHEFVAFIGDVKM